MTPVRTWALAFASATSLLSYGLASARPVQDQRESGRFDTYSADYRVENEFRFSPGYGGRQPDGRYWSVPDRWSDANANDDLGPEQRRRLEDEISVLTSKCGVAGGRFVDRGFQNLQATYLLKLRGKGRAALTRTIVRGGTAYEGPESSEPGQFTCMLDNNRVTLWIFDPA